jgi:hypothetical protein
MQDRDYLYDILARCLHKIFPISLFITVNSPFLSYFSISLPRCMFGWHTAHRSSSFLEQSNA